MIRAFGGYSPGISHWGVYRGVLPTMGGARQPYLLVELGHRWFIVRWVAA